MPPIKRWIIAPPIPHTVDQDLAEYPVILRRLLYNRGYTNSEQAHKFLQAESPIVSNAYLLTGISEAIERIGIAIQKNQNIAVYGDYDADGVTATALLVQALYAHGAHVQGYIPHRYDEGYGLNKDALDNLYASGVRLVITVDCGIRSNPEAEHARKIGLDLIITDHHQPLGELPPALAIINPKQASDQYPDKDLAGVGVAYKLACALDVSMEVPSPIASQYLDLVALGTVADLAPLRGENRALVRQGLIQLRQPNHQGILSLINTANIIPGKITAHQIGFMLGPRLNAAGRLDTALSALELLTTNDVQCAGLLAQKLDDQNRERQVITRQVQEKARELALQRNPNALLLFAAHSDFNPGVVGLAASKLVEEFYRPAIVAHRGEHYTRGSCRSIKEFHITQALDECVDLLEHHGGHAAAAGFTVANDRVAQLVEKLDTIAARELTDKELRPTLDIDLEISLRQLEPKLLEYLDWLQPTGLSNPQPLFLTRDLWVKRAYKVGSDGNHLKLTVSDGKIFFDCIGFNLGHMMDGLTEKIDLVYAYELNEYNGRQSLQLNVRDLRPTGGD